jgi:hypothetical protein
LKELGWDHIGFTHPGQAGWMKGSSSRLRLAAVMRGVVKTSSVCYNQQHVGQQIVHDFVRFYGQFSDKEACDAKNCLVKRSQISLW